MGKNTTEEHQVGNFLTVTTLAKPSPTAAVGCCPALRILALVAVAVTVISDNSRLSFAINRSSRIEFALRYVKGKLYKP